MSSVAPSRARVLLLAALLVASLGGAGAPAHARIVDCKHYLKPAPKRPRRADLRAHRPIVRGFKRTRKAISRHKLADILFSAAAAFKKAGVKYEEILLPTAKGGKMRAFRIAPDPKGHRFNRMAYYLQDGLPETKIVYSPANLREEDALGLFDIESRMLYLSELSATKLAIEPTDLHETTHWYHAWLYRKKIESLFHAEVESSGGPISEAGARANYEDYMSFEEATTFGLDDRTGVGELIEAAKAADAAKWDAETKGAFRHEIEGFLDTIDQHAGILEQGDLVTERARAILAEDPSRATITTTKLVDVDANQIEVTLDEAKGLKFRLFSPVRAGEGEAEILARAIARLEATHRLFADVQALLEEIPIEELKRTTRWTPEMETRLLDLTSKIRKRLVEAHRYSGVAP